MGLYPAQIVGVKKPCQNIIFTKLETGMPHNAKTVSARKSKLVTTLILKKKTLELEHGGKQILKRLEHNKKTIEKPGLKNIALKLPSVERPN